MSDSSFDSMHNDLMNRSSGSNRDFDLISIWATIRLSWRGMLFITLVTTVIAVILAYTLPPRWQAEVTIQTGRLPTESTLTGELHLSESHLIEDPVQVVERINLPQSKRNVLGKLGLPLDEGVDKRSDIYLHTLKSTVNKNTDFVRIVVRGYSAQDAERSLAATIDELKQEHHALSQPIYARVAGQIDQTQHQIAEINQETAAIEQQLAHANANRGSIPFESSMVALHLLDSKNTALNTFSSQEILYKALLSNMEMQATHPIHSIYVDPKVAFPNLAAFVLTGIGTGLLIGFVIGYVRYQRRP